MRARCWRRAPATWRPGSAPCAPAGETSTLIWSRRSDSLPSAATGCASGCSSRRSSPTAEREAGMPRYAYERLTALDNSFLLLEKPNAYMHVASTPIFDAGPQRRPEGGVDLEAIRAATEAALPQIPRYRQKLKYIPVENHPVWVDDDRFNLDYHLRHTALPKPGSVAQLKALSARIMQQHLDRSRPLWEMWLVEGLEGDRFALISKVHHCMIDGVSGVDLMNVQLRTTPDREIGELLPYFPRPAPSGLELLRHELLRRMALPFAAIRDVRDFMREAGDARMELAVRLRAVAETLGTTLRRA